MSAIQAKELLQGKALGCLDPAENENFNKLMEEDNDFPWQELGQYQNLVAFLPTLLDIKTPDSDVKDNIAKKLYEYAEKVKSEEKPVEVQEPKTDRESKLEGIEEEGIVIEEEDILKPEEPVEDPFQEKRPLVQKSISFREHGVLQVPVGGPKDVNNKTMTEQQNETETIRRPKLPKKEFDNKKVKSYVSKIPPAVEREESSKSNKMFLLLIIISAIALILIIIFYFKLSSDIQENRDEIQNLKGQNQSGILFDKSLSDFI